MWSRPLINFDQMVRAFTLRDLPLVHRLSEQGVSLHTELALIQDLHPTRGALFSLLGGDFPTYVWKAEKGSPAGFIQLMLEEKTHHGHIHFLSASPQKDPESLNGEEQLAKSINGEMILLNTEAWLALLDQAVVAAGQRGVHSLVAEVDETGPELPILRRAGFVVYTRQDIWQMRAIDPRDSPLQEKLQLRTMDDDWEIQLLYANIVPRLVQQVEPLPRLDDGGGWVVRENGDLAAFVHVKKGEMATWMRLFVHPFAEAQVEQLISAVAQKYPPTEAHPLYCCVRRYQSWVTNSLSKLGFSLWGSQAVMVKHTVHHARKPLPELNAALEAQGVTPSAPIVRHYQQHESERHSSAQNKDKRKMSINLFLV
jgi:hypothetical protein